MYREILLSAEDRALHRYIWRKEVGEPWVEYEMQRVTFGVTASPYVAIKTLQQAAKDFGDPYPIAQAHILDSFYVDDFLAGAATPKAQPSLSLKKLLKFCPRLVFPLESGEAAPPKF